ncbi:hypothetical protein RIF29_24293 [Crotalaria pallida]|uniref:DUF4005 domain-containing protein n=1 Tax=Crotalaria pallida TaxID=3830 RepID=A0AAN9EK98_CROPI
MGKAGKWIRNFLLGKKEEKFKKIDTYCSEIKSASMIDSQIISPNMKRRWSFGRLLRGGSGRKTGMVAGQKFSISFDSGDSARLQIQALLETQGSKNLPIAQVSKGRKDKIAAATKIQAAFRSYLARRALHALRGLVKLQALVRGYLVRKQTTATLRGMHALMAIQVRTRINRIQMVEEENLLGKQPSQQREIPHRKGLRRKHKDSKDMSVDEMLEALKNRGPPLDRSHMKSMEYDPTTFYSNRRSVSKRRHQYKESTLVTAPNSPEKYRFMSELNPTTMALSTSERHLVSQSHNQPWSPSYMNKTQSSRAKARSLSEPKQRPKKGTRNKNKSEESTKELSTSLIGPRHSVSSESSRFDQGSFDQWIIDLYGSTKDNRGETFGNTFYTLQ